jgi:hypothetical protein
MACGHAGASDRFADDGAVDASVDTATPEIVVPETIFPDTDPTLGGPCVDDAECSTDAIACATFTCDPTAKRCVAHPDDSKCDDGVFCNGKEACDPRFGCVPGPIVDCDSHDLCKIDHCVEATQSCAHDRRDLDGDGDAPTFCTGGDCDDHNPLVSSKTQEICGNHVDDNCNGVVDETPCVTPAHSTCATALPVSTDATVTLDLAGTTRTVGASCALPATYVRQAILAVTVGGSAPSDVQITMSPHPGGAITATALAAGTLCGDASTELRCALTPPSTLTGVLRLRNVAPGIYPVYVFGEGEAKVDVRVAYLAPTTPPTNLSCATVATGLDGATTSMSVLASIDDVGTFASKCTPTTGPLGWSITIPAPMGPQDLRVVATPESAGVSAIVGLRSAACDDVSTEVACGQGQPAEALYPGLAPGSYVLTVGATSAVDVAVEATLTPAATPPATATCATAPPLPLSTSTTVDFSALGDAVVPTCLTSFGAGPPTSAAAAYALPLSVPSDVLVYVREATYSTIAVGLSTASCAVAKMDTGCGIGAPTRINARAVPAGDYRAIVQTTTPTQAVSMTAFVRPTATPGLVGAPGCGATIVDVPSEGGFFTGTTVGLTPTFEESCDAVSGVGAPDAVYRLVLPTQSRVLVDAFGSAFATILSLRGGTACPGVEVSSGCSAGFFPGNAFLDVIVPAGTYWLIVDGYNNAAGVFDLDVRTTPSP